MKKIVNSIHWANIAGLAYNVFTALQSGASKQQIIIMAIQGVAGMLMPSLHGIGHKVAFGTDQAPEP